MKNSNKTNMPVPKGEASKRSEKAVSAGPKYAPKPKQPIEIPE